MDSEGVTIPMGPSSPCTKFIHHDDMVYEGWIDSRFTLVHIGHLSDNVGLHKG